MALFDQQAYLDAYVDVLRTLDCCVVECMARTIFSAWEMNRTVFCCGNGGSAASAGHFIADLTKLTAPPHGGRRVRAVALTESMPALSAIANDFSYEDVFVEQLRTFMERGDVVIGFSTSGASRNVLRAIEYANAAGGLTMGITGQNGTLLGNLAQQTLFVSASSVQHVEDATMVVAHLLCLHVKELIAAAADFGQTQLDLAIPALDVTTAFS